MYACTWVKAVLDRFPQKHQSCLRPNNSTVCRRRGRAPQNPRPGLAWASVAQGRPDETRIRNQHNFFCVFLSQFFPSRGWDSLLSPALPFFFLPRFFLFFLPPDLLPAVADSASE
jgi:hypothetical protein